MAHDEMTAWQLKGIQAEKEQLQLRLAYLTEQERALTRGKRRGSKPGKTAAAAPKRKMSAAGRKRIRESMKKRWAEAKKKGKKGLG